MRRQSVVWSVVLLLCLVAGCRKPVSLTGVSIDQKLSRLVPPATRSLAGIHADNLRDSSLWKKYGGELQTPAMLDAAREAGINPFTDTAEVIVSWDGKNVSIAAEGNFDSLKFREQLASRVPASTYGSKQLYSTPMGSLTFLDQHLLFAGTPAEVHRTIDAPNSATLPPSLTGLLKTLRRDDQIWMVSEGGLPFSDAPMRSDYQSMLSNFAGYVQLVAIGMHVDDGLHLAGKIQCSSDEGAKRVNDALRGAIGFGRLSTKDGDSVHLRMYDALQVSKAGQQVELKADLAPELAEQLLADTRRSGR